MSNNKAVGKKGAFARFQDWYASPKIKQIVSMCYSLGAAVVIIGALFKIMHWPGASIMLTVGMLTEVLLFALGVFDKPHVEYHWQNVYPELLDEHSDSELLETAPRAGASRAAGVGAVAATQVVGVGAVAGITLMSEEDKTRLTEGVATFTKTAGQFAELSAIVAPVNKLTANLTSAADITESFVASQGALSEAVKGAEATYQAIAKEVDNVQKSTESYSENLNVVNSHLSSINSLYELQLKTIKSQTDAYAQHNEKLTSVGKNIEALCEETAKVQQDAVATAQASEQCKLGVAKLSEQITDLNKVYGNMLNALS